jgi:Leucine-rich repeat (LRR) protein
LEGFLGLEQLHCANNALTALPAALPANLKVLDCSMNELTSLPPLPDGLVALSACSNPITNLPPLPASLAFLNGNFLNAERGTQSAESLSSEVALTVQPNPTRDVVFIRFSGFTTLPTTLTITDMSGKVWPVPSTAGEVMELQVSSLPAGTYVVSAGGVSAQLVKL